MLAAPRYEHDRLPRQVGAVDVNDLVDLVDLDLMGLFPELGKKYDPVYDATRSPFDCGVLYCEQYGIYYRVNDSSRRVVVFAIVNRCRNPKTRFDGNEYDAVGLG